MSQRCQTFISTDMNKHVGCSLTEEKRDVYEMFMARSAYYIYIHIYTMYILN